MFPPAARRVPQRWFALLANLMPLRYNFRHFNPKLPTAAGRDPLIVQSINALSLVVEALSACADQHRLDYLSPVFDPFAEP